MSYNPVFHIGDPKHLRKYTVMAKLSLIAFVAENFHLNIPVKQLSVV